MMVFGKVEGIQTHTHIPAKKKNYRDEWNTHIENTDDKDTKKNITNISLESQNFFFFVNINHT